MCSRSQTTKCRIKTRELLKLKKHRSDSRLSKLLRTPSNTRLFLRVVSSIRLKISGLISERHWKPKTPILRELQICIPLLLSTMIILDLRLRALTWHCWMTSDQRSSLKVRKLHSTKFQYPRNWYSLDRHWKKHTSESRTCFRKESREKRISVSNLNSSETICNRSSSER